MQGIVGKPVQQWYWSTNKLLETPIFAKIMTECRFSLIMKYLHFADNKQYNKAVHPAPKLKKIWELFQIINSNFQQVYIPDRDVCVDESLMAYKEHCHGCSTLHQSEPDLESFLCSASPDQDTSGAPFYIPGREPNGTKNIMNMVWLLLQFYRSWILSSTRAIVDNFYNSPELLDSLLKRSTDAHGTVRQNRRGLPVGFLKEKLKVPLQHGKEEK